MSRSYLMLLIAVLLSGCAVTRGYAPHSAYPISRDIAELHTRFQSASSITGYYAGADTAARRNEFIAGRLTLSNLEYIQFIRQFRLSRAQEQAAFDITQLGLGVATTLVAGERAKTVLGTITTALTGARNAYEKNFYDDQTTAALVTQMNAERKVALIPILAGTKASIEDYPLTQAIVDLTEYQLAGTIDGALQAVQRDAGVKDARASAVIDQYRTVSFRPDDMTVRIKTWLFPGAVSFDATGTARDSAGAPVALDAGRYASLQVELKTLGLAGIALPNFLGKASLAADRAKAVETLNIP